mgnify:CR=1 FL=1
MSKLEQAGASSTVSPERFARVRAIWQECIPERGGPYLFGARPTVPDAMYAPVCTRFLTYSIELDDVSAAYCQTIMKWPAVAEWVEASKAEPEQLEELEGDF